jgi:LacI family transcriptional regulator
MPDKKEITIYDLAKELNISAATVSRGLKNHPTISMETKKRIHDLAIAKGFRLNNFASSLRKNKTHTIGVMVHELNTSFMVSVLAGIENVLGQTEYDILITHSAEKGQKEITNASNLFHKRVDGLIASLAFDTPNLRHFDQFSEKKIPVVFFDRVEEAGSGAKVIIDNFRGGYEVTKHLINQGCKRIAHLTGNLSRNVYWRRFEGYKAALKEYDIPYEDKLLFVTSLNKEQSVVAARKMTQLLPMPDALFATGDFAAAMCIQTFKEAGLRIPQDIAVAGFNNDAISTIIEPHLTTINYSGFHMGEIAAKLLLDHLNGTSAIQPAQTITMNAELIVRASSLKQ